MIRFFREEDRKEVISLWSEAFGEKESEISVFLDFIKDNMCVFEKDGKVVSMLSLLPVKIGKKSGRYIYAVATDKRFRGIGYAGRLLEDAKRIAAEKGEEFLILLPRSADLFGFYEMHGFVSFRCAERIKRKSEFERAENVDVRRLSAKEYHKLRDIYFTGKKYVEWDVEALEFMERAYCGNFLLIESECYKIAAFCYKSGDTLVLEELLSDAYGASVIAALSCFFGVKKVVCRQEEKGKGFAMIYPHNQNALYFGLAME